MSLGCDGGETHFFKLKLFQSGWRRKEEEDTKREKRKNRKINLKKGKMARIAYFFLFGVWKERREPKDCK